MELTLGEIVRNINNKKYQPVAESMYESTSKLASNLKGDKTSWIKNIAAKLETAHKAKLAEGEFSLTKLEIGSSVHTEVQQWLDKEMRAVRPESKKVAFHLGIEK